MRLQVHLKLAEERFHEGLPQKGTQEFKILRSLIIRETECLKCKNEKKNQNMYKTRNIVKK